MKSTHHTISSSGTCSNSGIVQESHPPSPISLQRKITYDYIQDLPNILLVEYTLDTSLIRFHNTTYRERQQAISRKLPVKNCYAC